MKSTDDVKSIHQVSAYCFQRGQYKGGPGGKLYDIRITQIQVNGDAGHRFQVMPEVITGGFLVESVRNPVLSLSAPKDITPNSAMLEGIIYWAMYR